MIRKPTVKEPLYWFSIRGAHGKPWEFYLSTQQLSPSLRSRSNPRGSMGVTVYDEKRAYLNVDYCDRDIWETTLHELAHVALETAGFKPHEEERFVSAVEPGLSSFLSQLGFTMPALPAGTQSLRRAARRSRK